MADLLLRTRDALAPRYLVQRMVGRGGAAEVFAGLDRKNNDRPVAIKVMRPEVAAAVGEARFKQEIAFAGSFTHPYILPLHDSGEADGLLYYVTPLVEGKSLRDRLAEAEPIPIREAVTIAREVAEALDYAHRRRVVHRDIKPGNILLVDGHAAVADFGIARMIDGEVAVTLTRQGYPPGTPEYMAPERGRDGDVDERSDIYALGCVLYEMLTGTRPFPGTDAVVRARHLRNVVEPVTNRRPDAPPDICRTVERALEKDPSDRFQTAGEFAAELAAASPNPLIIGLLVRWRILSIAARRAGLALSALVLALVAVSIVEVGRPGGEDPRRSFLVQPILTPGMTAVEESMALEGASALTRLLGGWQGFRAVPTVSMAGLRFDLGLSGSLSADVKEALAMARHASVGTLVALTADVRRDTVLFEAVLFDTESGEPLDAPISTEGGRERLYDLLIPSIAAKILDWSGEPEALATLRKESDDFDALQELQAGIAALERWDLGEAELLFRAALGRDGGLARAHHNLALTLLWRVGRSPELESALTPDIRRHAATAASLGVGLPDRDATHVVALSQFIDGDYMRARANYDALIDTDSADAYAWLMRGAVEYYDPWAVVDDRGELTPRRDLTLAANAFTRAVRVNPAFELGYGHLFDIYVDLTRYALQNSCVLFERPRDDFVPPIGAFRRGEDQVAFCAIGGQTVRWVGRQEMEAMAREELVRSADAFLTRALSELDRWEQFAEASPEPRFQRAFWLLEQRTRLPWTGDPRLQDSIASEALRSFEAGLALKADTTSTDLFGLGSIRLAAGLTEDARLATLSALDEVASNPPGSAVVPPEAVAPFLATGEVQRALGVIAAASSEERASVADPVSGVEVRVWVMPLYRQMLVHGATGNVGAHLSSLLDDVERTWDVRGYDERQQRLLRNAGTGYVQTALMLDEGVARRWFDGVADTASLWGLALNPDAQRLAFVADSIGGRPRSVFDAYLLGTLAAENGLDATAAQYLDLVAAWPVGVDRADQGWGLRTLAQLSRARAHEALGSFDTARAAYQAFLDLRSTADASLSAPTQEAQRALARLR